MKINFIKTNSASTKDIESFEKESKLKLPNELIEFFKKYNGAKPESNIFKIGKNNDSGVNKFIEILSIFDEKKLIENLGTHKFPIAIAEGGNYVIVCLENNNQSIWFWDHEIPYPMIKLADNIFDFLESLSPYDTDSVELHEGQVESAWIDPDFLKEMK